MTRADGPAPYDLAVVGGGVLGLMTALFARRRHPRWRLAVIDRSLAGQGATRYSACLDYPYGSAPGVRELSLRSQDLFRRLRQEGADLPIVDLDLYGACDESRLESVRTRLTRPAERCPPGPGLEPPRIPGAIDGLALPAGSAVLRGLKATRCTDDSLADCLLQRLLAEPGTDLVEGAEVAHVGAEGGAQRLLTRDGRSFQARRVALCLGPWLVRGLPGLTGQASGLRVKKVVALHLPGAPAPGAPVICLFDHDAFFLPQPEKRRWLFSFRSEHWDCEPDPAALHLGADDLARAGAILARHLGAELPQPLGARVFCDAYSPAGEPSIAAVDGLPCCVAVGGAGGSGVRLAPGIAELALALIEQRRAP